MPLMPSIFRNFFGGSSSQQSTPPTPSYGGVPSSKSHTRSGSLPSTRIYASPPTPQAGSTSGLPPRTTAPNMQRSYSYSNTPHANPSPLRYATGTESTRTDTRTTYGYGRRAPSSHDSHGSRTPAQPRPSVLRRESSPRREAVHHPHFAPPSAPSSSHRTPPSSRSNSSSSLFGMGAVPMSTTGSDTGHYYSKESIGRSSSRPPLTRSNHTWHPGSSAGSASSLGSSYGQLPTRPAAYAQAHPRTQELHMHPLLAYTRLHRAPITYDVMFTPSARTVLDRTTHSAIPSHTLSQPATDPPTPSSSRLVLRSHKFPWPVVIGPSGPRFTIGSSKRSRTSSADAITILDVLYAVHTTLLMPVTPDEWDALGHGSRAQQKVTKAYEKRCTRMGGGWEGGVKRIDWLGSKTRLIGVEVEKSAGKPGTGKLVFGKA
ncbi:hypothetical protein BXZ70DRAFT_775189 [Cristinia sonorae]|uniref:DUF6699 domain-containing protein n=1 Tax=Cristinia sonorae TaxID=1940300 RepID=A0A8K0UES5_9AGAR|nr:hypothetical protein BXZ70DRAFT_775189 [Cristinia sonorae]